MADRPVSITRDPLGRPCHGRRTKIRTDPTGRTSPSEYFGDTGEGLGASHETLWTGLVARLIANRGRRPGDPR
jgi:hypothetical protein